MEDVMNNQNCEKVKINNVENYITGSFATQASSCGYTGTKAFYSINNVRYIGSYNADLTIFASLGNPWFLRGGSCAYGTYAGVFDFANDSRNAGVYGNFRVILTP